MEKKYDLVVDGGGPGGYVAAIRASQLGKKVAVIEKESLGGVCLNWGCIPTKSLLKNAQIFDLIKKSKNYGIEISDYKVNWSKIIQRSRNISKRLSKGIENLMNKNKIDHFAGLAKLIDKNTIEIDSENGKDKCVKISEYKALNKLSDYLKKQKVEEAEYQGRKVKLNSPMQGDVKKFKVYVKNSKGNVVKVNFGQKGMVIKKDNPEARKSFRARHKCDQKKDKTSAGYWSCKKW